MDSPSNGAESKPNSLSGKKGGIFHAKSTTSGTKPFYKKGNMIRPSFVFITIPMDIILESVKSY